MRRIWFQFLLPVAGTMKNSHKEYTSELQTVPLDHVGLFGNSINLSFCSLATDGSGKVRISFTKYTLNDYKKFNLIKWTVNEYT